MKKSKSVGVISEFVKALVVSIIVTLLLVLLFAVLIKFCSIDWSYISLVNQVIKSLSVLVGILVGFTKRPNGWLRGFVFGIMYVAVSFVLFSALNGEFEFGISLLNDLVLVGITGMISGIIAVNVKKAVA